jgi:hypothetical protein
LSSTTFDGGTSWQEFLTKIATRQIQFYILESEWYIVFNPNNTTNNQIIEVKLPNYLSAKNISL